MATPPTATRSPCCLSSSWSRGGSSIRRSVWRCAAFARTASACRRSARRRIPISAPSIPSPPSSPASPAPCWRRPPKRCRSKRSAFSVPPTFWSCSSSAAPGGFMAASIGAIVYMVARDQFSGLNPQYWYFWIGLLLIAVVMLLPNGILGGLDAAGAAAKGQVVSASALAARGVNKNFGSLVVASDVDLDLPAGRALRADRPQRRRQDHADQSDDRHAAAGFRPHLSRRRGHHRAAAGAARAARAGSHLPDQFAVSRISPRSNR